MTAEFSFGVLIALNWIFRGEDTIPHQTCKDTRTVWVSALALRTGRSSISTFNHSALWCKIGVARRLVGDRSLSSRHNAEFRASLSG